MKLNQVWDMGELIDLGADIYEGMTQVPPPTFPPVQVREIDLSARSKGRGYVSYSQSVLMPVQVSTYLETGAHLYPEMEKVHEVGLDRLFLSAVVLQIPRGPGEKVTAPDIESELTRSGEVVNPGEALLIATGYDLFKETDFKNSPHFRYDAVEWAVQRHCPVLGSDMGAWQDPGRETALFPYVSEIRNAAFGPHGKSDQDSGGADQTDRDAAQDPRGLRLAVSRHRGCAGLELTRGLRL